MLSWNYEMNEDRCRANMFMLNEALDRVRADERKRAEHDIALYCSRWANAAEGIECVREREIFRARSISGRIIASDYPKQPRQEESQRYTHPSHDGAMDTADQASVIGDDPDVDTEVVELWRGLSELARTELDHFVRSGCDSTDPMACTRRLKPHEHELVAAKCLTKSVRGHVTYLWALDLGKRVYAYGRSQ